MNRSLPAVLLACACAFAASTAGAREVQRLSAADAGHCPDEVAAAKADADDKQDAATVQATAQAAKPSPPPVRRQPSVRGGDTGGSRLQAPRWHSFLPGMFR